MTLDEAIKILEINNDRTPTFTDAQRQQAHQLGIEAIKRLQDNRRDPEFDHWIPLPGETQDEPTVTGGGIDVPPQEP